MQGGQFMNDKITKVDIVTDQDKLDDLMDELDKIGITITAILLIIILLLYWFYSQMV